MSFPGETRIAVWDCRDRWPGEAAVAWLREHLPAGARFVYRVEFYDGDLGPRAKIYSYAPDGDGKRRWCAEHDGGREHDHRGCYAVEDPPRFVPLGELPPSVVKVRAA